MKNKLSNWCQSGTHDGCHKDGKVITVNGKRTKCGCACHQKPVVAVTRAPK